MTQDDDKVLLKRLLPFLILMGTKWDDLPHPSYVLEKYLTSIENPNAFAMLDSKNMKKLQIYLEYWKIDDLYREDEIESMNKLAL